MEDAWRSEFRGAASVGYAAGVSSQSEPSGNVGLSRILLEAAPEGSDLVRVVSFAPPPAVEAAIGALDYAGRPLREEPSAGVATGALVARTRVRFLGTVVPALERLVGADAVTFATEELEGQARRAAGDVEAHYCPRSGEHRCEARDGELLVSCHFEDREQAKRVPGYRWDPDRRVWVYPDSELHRTLVALAFRVSVKGGEEPPETPPGSPAVTVPPPAREGRGPGIREVHEGAPILARWQEDLQARLAQVERRLVELTAALERAERRLTAQLDALLERVAVRPTTTELPHDLAAAMPDAGGPGLGTPDPLSLLRRCLDEPEAALRELEGQLARAPTRVLRALEAVAAWRAGKGAQAMRALEASGGTELPVSLAEVRGSVLEEAALAPFAQALGTGGRTADEVLLALGGALLRGGLAKEAAGQLLRAAELEAWGWVARERPDLGETRDAVRRAARAVLGLAGPETTVEALALLRPESSPALLLVSLATAVTVAAGGANAPRLARWWPKRSFELDADHAERALAALRDRAAALPRELHSAVALGALALAAPFDQAVVPMRWRRALLDWVPHEGDERTLAEFFAAFRPALQEDATPSPDRYPGLAHELCRRIEAGEVDAPTVDAYLEELTLQGERAWKQAIVVGGVLSARVRRFGLPEGDSFAVLDDLASAADDHGQTWNELARLLEDGEAANSGSLGSQALERVYARALEAARENANQSVEAFYRFLRHADEYWEDERALSWLADQTALRPRSRQLAAATEFARRRLARANSVEDVVAAVEPLVALISAGERSAEVGEELAVLLDDVPAWRDAVAERFPLRRSQQAGPSQPARPLRLVVVGGHQDLRRHAQPRIEARGHFVTWLDPDEAKQGSRLRDAASGSCDYVLVIIPYVSHAANERARQEAGGKYRAVPSNGVVSLLREVEQLERSAANRGHERRRHLMR